MPFYVELARYIRILRAALPGESLRFLNAKKIYETLFHACKRDLVRTHVSETRGLLLSPILDDDRADLAWEISHNVLPVATRLVRFRFRASNACATCGQIENHKHIFFDCVLASALWRKMAALFALARIEYSTVHVFDPVPVDSGQIPAFALLLNEIKYQLWASRNRKMYGGCNESLRLVTFYVRASLRRKLQYELDILGVVGFKKRWKRHWKVFVRTNGKISVIF